MTVDVRATGPAELRQAANAIVPTLLGGLPDDEAWERTRPSWEEMASFSAWDGHRCVGHAGHFLVDTTVPGGARVPTAAVSRVGVLASHRRRGIATRLMETLVCDAVERSLVLMSLRASEAVIYQRYGFGLAGDDAQIRLLPRRAAPIAGADPDGSFRLLDPAEILDLVPELYDRIAHRRPGVVTRPMSWWRRYYREATERSNASYVAVHAAGSGELDGFVHYDVEWDDTNPDGPTGRGSVHDLFGRDDRAELTMWQYLCDVDLVTTWTTDDRPVDDLVRHAVRDPRSYRTTGIEDEQWLRIADVDRALGGRTYGSHPSEVVISVADPLIEANNGRWRVGAHGAVRTVDAPDVTTDIGGLSSTYLGGRTWTALAATGSVTGDPEALATADALFTTTRLPFCGSFF